MVRMISAQEVDAILLAYGSISQDGAGDISCNGRLTLPQTRMLEEWATHCDNLGLLLSREEETFDRKMQLHVLKDRLSRPGFDGSEVLQDTVLADAIAHLQDATARLVQQSTVLSIQNDKYKFAPVRVPTSSKAIELIEAGRSSESNASHERQSNSSDTLRTRLHLSDRQMRLRIAQLQASTDDLFAMHDAVIEQLRGLIATLARGPALNELPSQISRLCDTLATTQTDSLRKHIDEVYVQWVDGARGSQSKIVTDLHQSDKKAQNLALQSELNELLTEIDQLTAMAGEALYGRPLSRQAHLRMIEEREKQANVLNHCAEHMGYITAYTQRYAVLVLRLHAHANTIQHLQRFVENSTRGATQTQLGTVDMRSAEPGSTTGLKPLRLVREKSSEPKEPTIEFLECVQVQRELLQDRADLDISLARLSDGLGQAQIPLNLINSINSMGILLQIAPQVVLAPQSANKMLNTAYKHAGATKICRTDQEIESGLEQARELSGILKAKLNSSCCLAWKNASG